MNNGRPLFKTFLKYFLSTVIAFIILFSAVIGGLYLYANSKDRSQMSFNENAVEADGSVKKSNPILDMFSSLPKRTVFAIFGVDEDATRTDTILVGCFNSATKKINLISIPRDTYVVMPKERRDILKEAGLWTPANGVMKINQVHHYAGSKYGVEFAVKQLEELLGIKIPYYVKVDTEAFRYIVDNIGGVEFDVPQRMYYNDPEQNLHIDLQPGLQVLKGKDAEGLVRYREADKTNRKSAGYARGDLERVEVQQAFLKALIGQVFSKETIINNFMTMINAAYKYVDTNFSLTEAPKYLKYLSSISSENVETATLPCEAKMIDGQSFVLVTEDEKTEMIQSIFYDKANVPEISGKGKSIQVLNGSNKSGVAARNKEYLLEQGFDVAAIGDYTGAKMSNDRILVKKDGMGADIQRLYPGSKIIVDKSLSEYDIVLIIGTETQR